MGNIITLEIYKEKFPFRNQVGIHTIANSKPPPKARPSMAATNGFLAAEK